MVNHSGSLSYGHYTASCRLGTGADREWYRLNDSSVTATSEADVVSNEAYMSDVKNTLDVKLCI